MGSIVAAFGLPHTPLFPAMVERDGPECKTAKLYATVAHHFAQVQPDALVVFTSDHLNTFFLDNYPNLLIGVSDHTVGPNDGTPGLGRRELAVHEALASHIYAFALRNGFDPGLSQEFEVDHSVMVPLHFLGPAARIPIVPVFLNGVVHPLPNAARCHAVGRMIRAAVEAFPGPERVAVLASGSWTLDVGGHLSTPGQQIGTPDPAWASTVLAALRAANVADLLEAATADRIAGAGNVAGELLNWLSALGVVGDLAPRSLEPQVEWGHAYGVWRWD